MQTNDSGIRIEENVLKGKDAPLTFKYTNLGEAVLDALENDEDFVGLVDPVTDEKYAFRTMRDRSIRCALWMRAQGLQPGDVVAICSEKKLDIGLPCYAALYIGAVFSPLDAGMNATNFSHLLELLKPKMAFTNVESANRIAEAAQGANLDMEIVVFGRMPGFLEYERVVAEPTDEEVKNFKIDRTGSPDDTAFILCSSGTTGIPKGVALSHKTYLGELGGPEAKKMSGMTSIVFSHLHWISGTFMIFINVFRKMTSIVAPSFEEYSSCGLIEKHKVNFMMISSSMVSRWLKSDALGRYDLSSIKHIICGGAPLIPFSSKEAFAKYVPHAMVNMAYGLTEVGGPTVSGAIRPTLKPGSSGPILDGVHLKVVDPVTNRICGANTTGELIVKSTIMMNCYYNDPETTARDLDAEGWLRTGDLGYYDEDGEVFVVERSKAIMNYRGHPISPVRIESVLLSHDAVKEAVVVGLSHPEDGEHPIALVVKVTDPLVTKIEVTETELIDLVASQLSDVERLRGGVRFIDSLPRSSSGKILRKLMRDIANSSVHIHNE